MHTMSSVIGLDPFSVRAPLQSTSLCTFHWNPKVSLHAKVPKAKCSYPRRFPVSPVLSSNDDAVSVLDFEDLAEKNWSILDMEYSNADGELMQKMDRIISAGNIDETSRILVSFGSEAFVDRLVSSSAFEHLLVVHDSLFVLASIKEKYDKIKCWQGPLNDIPGKWSPFDVLFLCFLPALPLDLDQVLASLGRHCSPGARVVISHPQGKQGIEEQKQKFPNVVVSGLPEQRTLLQAAAEHQYHVVETIDDGGFYLSLLQLNTV